jgi:transposase
LIPCQDQSAGKNRLGHITREGPPVVRSLLTEAAWQGIRRSAHLKAYFQRMTGMDPLRRKIALVATAHYLARVMLAMLRSGQAWRYETKGGKQKAA